MNKVKLSIVFFFSYLISIGQSDNGFHKSLTSPDTNYEINISKKLDDLGKSIIKYSVNYKGKQVILDSRFNIELDNHLNEWALAVKDKPKGNWMDELVLTDFKVNNVSNTWKPIFGERNTIENNYNELVLTFEQKASSNYKMDIQLRAYNQGVAFRYYFHTNPTGIYYHITEENTEFTFAKNTKAWFEPWAQGTYELLPLNDWPTESERPLTLELENGLYACIAEAGLVDFVRTKFKLSDLKKNTIKTALYESIDKVPYFGTSWRVIMAADTAGELIENNDILLNLNEPSAIKDTNWIKPGKIVRDISLTEKGAKAWIDFAAEHNLQYVLFDWKWYGPSFTFDSDARTVDIDLDLQSVIDYGKEKGIGIWVYVNQQALLKQDFEIFPLYKEWGVVGVKYGFVQVGSHRWTTWLHESIKRAADNQLMVNIHDEFRVTGEQRTLPNIMTVEGIRGNEEFPDATHNTTLPFTRGIAGMGDYTVCYYDKRLKTTHAHQLALSVVMYSPLQTLYWYDTADMYEREPEIAFFDAVPTVWDDTKILNGKIGEYITIARKSGKDWFIGSITNNDARDLEISLDFLDEGSKYKAIIYLDDSGVKTKTKVGVKEVKVKKGKKIKLNLLASGGTAIQIKKIVD
ncbi:glycoside hydrolase family 97 N-terminal domain-containing protein [Mariniflexile jejuense]|uniref:Glycoside hydrolase family 97 N-terminal domain-containing protein n=1 Tax=Mariniflexile jejuense TaxID=1173582 RepID=A0ABW3JPA1_9FLAO